MVENDDKLIELVAGGDKKAFAVLFERHYKSLASYVHKLTESFEVTEEIVQDVFIKIWLKRENLRGINNINNYLFIISRNQTLNYLKKKANNHLKFKDWEKQFQTETEDVNENHDENFHLLIDKAIEALPAQQKKIYQLRREEKLKYEEIALRMNISLETVRKHIYLATKTIKEYVKNHMDDMVLMILLTSIIDF